MKSRAEGGGCSRTHVKVQVEQDVVTEQRMWDNERMANEWGGPHQALLGAKRMNAGGGMCWDSPRAVLASGHESFRSEVGGSGPDAPHTPLTNAKGVALRSAV